MSNRARDIIVGLTGMVGVAGVAFLMVVFGYAPAWLEDGYDVTVTMPHASGLREGSRVRFSGKDVGRIKSVVLRGAPKWGVEVVAIIGAAHDVPAGVGISVESPILGGSPALALEPPRDSDGKTFLPRDGTALLEVREAIPSLASHFAAELRSGLKATVDDLREELSRAQGNLDRLAGAWVSVAEHLDVLLAPKSPSEVDATGSVGNVSSVVARADARLAELEAVIAGMAAWVGDTALRESIGALAGNANRMTLKMYDGVDEVTATATDTARSLDTLVIALVTVSGELSQAISTARTVLGQVTHGEGTAGRVLRDPALYNSMQDAFERLSRALNEMRMLVEKWQREGLSVEF